MLGVLATLGAQLVGAGVYMAKIDTRFEGLTESDARLTKRSDERYATVVERIVSLERDRSDSAGRLIRLEEQVRMESIAPISDDPLVSLPNLAV